MYSLLLRILDIFKLQNFSNLPFFLNSLLTVSKNSFVGFGQILELSSIFESVGFFQRLMYIILSGSEISST